MNAKASKQSVRSVLAGIHAQLVKLGDETPDDAEARAYYSAARLVLAHLK